MKFITQKLHFKIFKIFLNAIFIMITILNKHSVKVSTKSESGCGDDY